MSPHTELQKLWRKVGGGCKKYKQYSIALSFFLMKLYSFDINVIFHNGLAPTFLQYPLSWLPRKTGAMIGETGCKFCAPFWVGDEAQVLLNFPYQDGGQK